MESKILLDCSISRLQVFILMHDTIHKWNRVMANNINKSFHIVVYGSNALDIARNILLMK